jgi:protocatechuate 3,4-dioxygenase beta subunit
MDRKKFLKKGMASMGTIVAIPTVLISCNKDENTNDNDPSACTTSPVETAGPFPIKTPADLVRENILGNKVGVPLLINFTIQNTNDNCAILQGVFVDIWQCDAKGNYSEYSGQLDGNFTNEHFLRGRQTTDANGNASFISIYPGWYPGRTPHLHIEIKNSSGSSLLITQVSFPEDVSNTVYATTEYKGAADTDNSNDGIVGTANLADSVVGNTADGYTLKKVIKVAG